MSPRAGLPRIVMQRVSAHNLMVILRKGKEKTLERSKGKKQRSCSSWESVWWSCSSHLNSLCSVVIIWPCWWEDHRRQNTAWVIGSSYFFPHLSRSEGREKGANRERRWEASVLIIAGYWPLALTDGRKMGVSSSWLPKLHLYGHIYRALHLRGGGWHSVCSVSSRSWHTCHCGEEKQEIKLQHASVGTPVGHKWRLFSLLINLPTISLINWPIPWPIKWREVAQFFQQTVQSYSRRTLTADKIVTTNWVSSDESIEFSTLMVNLT